MILVKSLAGDGSNICPTEVTCTLLEGKAIFLTAEEWETIKDNKTVLSVISGVVETTGRLYQRLLKPLEGEQRQKVKRKIREQE